jgi:thiol:disulfide interchange protein DsbD
LVTAARAAAPGQTFRIGVLFSLATGWHLYWRNPGEAGLPPRIDWRLPAGWTVKDCPWPAPRRFAEEGLVVYGYADSVLLAAVVTAPSTMAPGTAVELHAEVSWLACKDACVPGSATLSEPIRIAAKEPARDAADRALFDRFEQRWPQPPANWSAAAWRDGDTLVVSFRPDAGAALPPATPLDFFPAEAGLVAVALDAPRNGPVPGARFRIRTLADEHRALGQVTGVLAPRQPVSQDSAGIALQFDVPVSDRPHSLGVAPPHNTENTP